MSWQIFDSMPQIAGGTVMLADSVPLLYAGRLLQGAVSGVVFSVANAWLQELAGPDRQQSAATRGAVSTSLGFAIAPAVSGVLAEYASWRWIFVLNLPLGVAGLLLAQLDEELAATA